MTQTPPPRYYRPARNPKAANLTELLRVADRILHLAGLCGPKGIRTAMSQRTSRSEVSDDQIAAARELLTMLSSIPCGRCSSALQLRMQTREGRPVFGLNELAAHMRISKATLDRAIAVGLTELSAAIHRRGLHIVTAIAPTCLEV